VWGCINTTSRRRFSNKDWEVFSKKLSLILVSLSAPPHLTVTPGVDINTASSHVLSYASGINKSQAAAIVEHRVSHGPFRSREEIKNVKGIGRIAFQNSAGFLRVMDGIEPLDSTIVHPEKYSIVKSLLTLVSAPVPSDSDSPAPAPPPEKKTRKKTSSRTNPPLLPNSQLHSLLFSQQLRHNFLHCNWVDLSLRLNEEMESLKLLSKWISDPFYNSTSDMDLRGMKGVAPLLTKKCLLSPQDYQQGLRVRGVVRNITSFGAFVDIGAKEDALMHRTKYGSRHYSGFVIGEVIFCRVLAIDPDRGKISLVLAEEGEEEMREQRAASERAPVSITLVESGHENIEGSAERIVSRKKRRRPET
jgi:protein Tex